MQPTPTSTPASSSSTSSSAVEGVVEDSQVAVGLLDDATLAKILPPWRLTLRAPLAHNLAREMPYLERIQSSCRTPFLDVYFMRTSLLGSHTFFMVFIPTFFWFGFGDVGRGLLYILAAGGYSTSVLKDFFCIARPFSPPLVRLSVGNHHHEYGFPSTHSTNSVSMALYFGLLVHLRSTAPSPINIIGYLFFLLFALTVTFGRLYTGMHSILDVTVGSLIGIIVWAAHTASESAIERFTTSNPFFVTGVMLPSILFLVFVHPAPAEDCPCFEDAVAFISVVLGLVVGRTWCHTDFIQPTIGTSSSSSYSELLGSSVWVMACFAKLVIGILSIFAWRMAAKEVCHAVLPPTFRFFSSFLLPRRHYVKATDYDNYKNADSSLNPIPSLLDLPSLDEEGERVSSLSSFSSSSTVSGSNRTDKNQLRNRYSSTTTKDGGTLTPPAPSLAPPSLASSPPVIQQLESVNVGKKKGSVIVEDPIRRDADVLTKVIVYCGIGWISAIAVPTFFLKIGLSVPS